MKKNLIPLLLLISVLPAAAQIWSVDRQGVLRNTKTQEEAAFFGVNYTAPFAHAYRQLHRLGADIKQTIDKDTYHMARMGVTAYRIHVWDYEITDSEGGLLDNEHLDLFDYLISRLEERGIHIVLTMMMGSGNGYPEPGEDLPGFERGWSKAFATSDPGAAVIEENYIRNFLNHGNRYTGLSFKDDPMIIGFEINNEPTNSTPPKETTAFVDRMIRAVRSTGCRKPVFYNVSHNFQNTQAFYDSKMDGGTFQWYPTGLVANHTRRGNFLPHVAEYKIPFENIRGFERKARIVYEFDAADQWASYLYPAIVRSFRGAGFQWVTFFAYDPIDMAQINTEYQTHYLNLAYTPSKAISFKIAAEAMRVLPRGSSWGNYPESNRFGDFLVDYAKDLSLLNSGEKFYYSNSPGIAPKDPAALRSVAGVGTSSVVRYEGTGAYFLDRVEDGVWRLEVMPDQVLLSDPFAKASPRKEVNTILWNDWPIGIELPDLGADYSFRRIDGGAICEGRAEGTEMSVSPGTWLLARKGVSLASIDPERKLGNIALREFVAPGPRQKTLEVLHESTPVTTANHALTVSAQVIGPEAPDSVVLWSSALARRNPGGEVRRQGPQQAPTRRMKRSAAYTYEAVIPAENIAGEEVSYYIIAYSGGQAHTFPGNADGLPSDWDFYNGEQSYRTTVEAAGQAITIFSPQLAAKAEPYAVKLREPRKQVTAGPEPGTRTTQLSSALPRQTGPGQNYAPAQVQTGEAFLRLFIADAIAGRRNDLAGCHSLFVKVDKAKGLPTLRLGFITRDGFSYKTDVPCSEGIIEIPLSSLRLTHTAIRPVTYPGFLPDWFEPDATLAPAFRVEDIETFEIGTAELNADADWSVSIGSCWML